MAGKPQKFWVVYDDKTDEIVASGDARECAKQMGSTLSGFYDKVNAAKYGKVKKYVIVEVEE